MISYITGIVAEVTDKAAVVETGGIGYAVYIPSGLAAELGAGMETKLYTHFHVAEDSLKLYGFGNAADRELFRLLITVSGVGPKAAMAIMSSMSSDELKLAIISDDEKKIAKAQGLGPKTAKKVILELKDKIKTEDILGTSAAAGGEKDTEREDAIQALVALGYSASEALKAVSRLDTQGQDSGSIVRLALRELGR